MFGYVNISQNSITDEDKLIYKSYYCGLCKAIGKKSQRFRLTLNNDLTFLAVLLSGLEKEEPHVLKDKKCIVHHIKKHDEIAFDKVLDYVSDMNILLVYLKVLDDVVDDKKLSSLLLKAILKGKAKRVEKKHSTLSNNIKSELLRLKNLEDKNSSSLDEVADCFAKILELVFGSFYENDTENKKIMSWLGYNLGRWIYIIDAFCDIEKDKKKNSYNPFISSHKDFDDIKNLTYETLTYTLNNIASAYDLLRIQRNDTLIKNILYQGLYEVQQSAFTETEEKDESL